MNYAPLYYKVLEIEKDDALKPNNGNFEAKLKLSDEGRSCIQWWIDNVASSFKLIEIQEPVLILKSDSSMYAWGCINETTRECTRDTWSEKEQQCHINYLELKAGFLSIKHFCKNTKNCHIQLYMDNTVAVTYINKMGGNTKALNDLTRQIWHWCIVKDIWISACHVAGVENKEADFLSRDKNSDMEWMLNTEVFQLVQKIFGNCDIDLFASKDNHQLSKYVSYLPDKSSEAVDAFSISWTNL